jgi:[CysO sulfur-carrier protein]-S-L-cysteine hydrolase
VRIRRQKYDELIAHARSEAPNESCGLLGAVDGEAVDFYPARNAFESPMRFEIDPKDLFRINGEIEERGQEMVLFHSHPKTEAYPSQTDINRAEWLPGVLWLICSLADPEPVVRAFEIEAGAVEEVELVVE